VVTGLHTLKQHYMIMPFSNGDLLDRDRKKRRPAVGRDYFGHDAANLMQLATDEIMMVACHAQDLAAAIKSGMRTAYVARPLEYGPVRQPEEKSVSFDYDVSDFIELADALKTDRDA
jgi:2-haloacid dehalogenase